MIKSVEIAFFTTLKKGYYFYRLKILNVFPRAKPGTSTSIINAFVGCIMTRATDVRVWKDTPIPKAISAKP